MAEGVENATAPPQRSGGISAWSTRHPIGVSMMALAVVVVGVFTLTGLKVNLLPHIIYPEVEVRIADSGVPAQVMEDDVTRQLEEQLAITEDAIAVQSRTREGRSAVSLTFSYGKDIDIALRDASTRLDRAKRFLPDTIDPPIIFKRDPSQIPVLEFVVSSRLRDQVELREWADYVFGKWFVNLPGVAAAEIGGGMRREIAIFPDPERLAGVGLSVTDLREQVQSANVETAGGQLRMADREITGRTTARFTSVDEIRRLPISTNRGGETIPLGEVAQVVDGHEDEKLRIRLNKSPGIKLSIQKQPTANTVAVVDVVVERLAWLREQHLVPDDIAVEIVSDQAVFVRQAIKNATRAAATGALLAVIVVFVFLGDVRRTLVIGTAIPIAVMVTIFLMGAFGLTINIMTLGGLALGIGMLVDNAIVMLENIYRHQREGESTGDASTNAAREVNSAILASSTTNLVAVAPFLFIGGLVGLLFQELIATISAAIIASLVVAVTLVPALAGRIPVHSASPVRRATDWLVGGLQNAYAWIVRMLLKAPWLMLVLFVPALYFAVQFLQNGKQEFLPRLDEGRIQIRLSADAGVSLDEMDNIVDRIETLLEGMPEVRTVFASIGGFVFGRSVVEATNRSRIDVQLVNARHRAVTSNQWLAGLRKSIRELQLVGVQVRIRSSGIRGIRFGRGDDDLSIRVQGPDLDTLARIGEQLVERLKPEPSLRNVRHSYEDFRQELAVVIDRERARALGLDAETVGDAVRFALQGLVISDFIDQDRRYNVRMRLPQDRVTTLRDLETLLLFPASGERPPVYLGGIARVDIITAPAQIVRDSQRRMVEVTASVAPGATLGESLNAAHSLLADVDLPDGYVLYDGGEAQSLQEGKHLGGALLGLALFLVFVVMAVQYESLRNPFIILLSVPFAAVGVAVGIWYTELPITMPVWLGLVMLAGIVVNNAIILVEYIEIERSRGMHKTAAIISAARLRLRPILMTTLTTAVGMLPLAMGVGEGSEMLRPLAVTVVGGLSFSLLVSLLLIPTLYQMFGTRA